MTSRHFALSARGAALLDELAAFHRRFNVPGIGQHRIHKLQPEHLERTYRAMLDAGHAASHVVKAHRIPSRALKIAHRRRITSKTVATLVDPPGVDETEANPFTKEEARALLEAAAKRPTFMRWIVGVVVGFRRGESLGLRWPYVDLGEQPRYDAGFPSTGCADGMSRREGLRDSFRNRSARVGCDWAGSRCWSTSSQIRRREERRGCPTASAGPGSH